MNVEFIALAATSIGAIAISAISMGLVKKYDPNQILYWHLNRAGEVEGYEDAQRESQIILSDRHNRYGTGIVKEILYYGTLNQARTKLKNLRKNERLIARALGKDTILEITISALNAKLTRINDTDRKRFEKLCKEIVAENRDLFRMLQSEPEPGLVLTFESKIENIVRAGIIANKTDEEIKIKAKKSGYSI